MNDPHEIASDWTDEAPTDPRIALDAARVIVADDDDELRSVVTTTLIDEGFAVHEAGSGLAVLEMLERARLDAWPDVGIDLLIVDHRMPGTTGLEVLSLLRASRWDMPAILMTAFPDDALVERATRLGAKVLAKPFGANELTRSAIALLLARSAVSATPGSSWRLTGGRAR